MFEVKLTVELPGIPEAINNLADALRGKFTPGASVTPAIVNNGSGTACAEVHGGMVINHSKNEKAPEEKPVESVLTPVEPVNEQPPLAEVPAPVAPAPVAPAPAEQPAPVAPVAPAPVKKYTFKQISTAGAKLCTDGEKMGKLVTLLNTKYGVQAITMIDESRYGELAADLMELGAVIEEG